jgi:hypothetical protein
MQKLTLNKRSVLRVLLGVYLFPFYLVVFSLSVPPADLPLCGLLFVLAVFGLVLGRRESRAWRVVWTFALIMSVVFVVLQFIAGRNIAHQRSKDDAGRGATTEISPAQRAGFTARKPIRPEGTAQKPSTSCRFQRSFRTRFDLASQPGTVCQANIPSRSATQPLLSITNVEEAFIIGMPLFALGTLRRHDIPN